MPKTQTPEVSKKALGEYLPQVLGKQLVIFKSEVRFSIRLPTARLAAEPTKLTQDPEGRDFIQRLLGKATGVDPLFVGACKRKVHTHILQRNVLLVKTFRVRLQVSIFPCLRQNILWLFEHNPDSLRAWSMQS